MLKKVMMAVTVFVILSGSANADFYNILADRFTIKYREKAEYIKGKEEFIGIVKELYVGCIRDSSASSFSVGCPFSVSYQSDSPDQGLREDIIYIILIEHPGKGFVIRNFDDAKKWRLLVPEKDSYPGGTSVNCKGWKVRLTTSKKVLEGTSDKEGKMDCFEIISLEKLTGDTRSKKVVEGQNLVISANFNELKSNLKFKLDPKRYSVIIFGFSWKSKRSVKEYPLTVLDRSIPMKEGSFHNLYYEGRFEDQGFHKFAESEALTLYFLFAETECYYPGDLEKLAIPNACNSFNIAGFTSGDHELKYVTKKAGKSYPATLSFPVKPGLIHYIGDFMIHVDPTFEEKFQKPLLPSRSDEILQWIRKNFSPFSGFRFE